MTTPDIAGLCERLRKPVAWQSLDHDYAEWELRSDPFLVADTLERQAAEIERLRGALAEAGMRIETCPGAYKSHDEIIVQKIQAALTGKEI